jgi:menaquinone-dependent protoporphyrinogen oxidase
MKPVGIFYATREGQTERIAERIGATLRASGLEPDLRNLKSDPEEITLDRYSAAILAASVHAGSHEPEMVKFAQRHRAQLDTMPNAFLSVTLSQVGVEDSSRPPAERDKFAADVASVLAKFRQETGWTPKCVKPVAGALPYSKYNFFIRYIMKRIARKAGAPTDTSRDYDFTNWTDLEAFATGFAGELSCYSSK